MSRTTEIEWTEHTWNPFAGCSVHTAGCTNCYAMRQAARIEEFGSAPHYAGLTQKINGQAVWTGKVHLASVATMQKPKRIAGSALVFVNSMSDFWHPQARDEWRIAAIEVMRACPRHAFQVLTKRTEEAEAFFERHPQIVLPDNFWAGATVEHARTRHRIDSLRRIPAKVRFLSIEPLIAPVGIVDLADIDWIITGGESGPDCRMMRVEWLREMRDQAIAQGVPHFFKQWGHWRNNPLAATAPPGMTPARWVAQQDPVGKGGSQLDGRAWKQMPSCWKPLQDDAQIANVGRSLSPGLPAQGELGM